MTREEIVKALRCCNSDDGCRGCPLEMADLPQGTCVDKVLFAAADLLEQDAEKTSWISVKDRLPDEDLAYMVFYHEWSNGEFLPKYDERYVKILKFFRGLGWRFPVCVDKRCENDTNRDVTHWMPLPDIEGIDDET